MKAVLVVLLFVFAISAQVKKPESAPIKVPFAESLQAVVVTTEDWTDTKGEAQLYERKDLKSRWKAVRKEFEIVVGRTGLAWARDSAPESANVFKQEGDGKSPAGTFPLTFAFGRTESTNTKLPYRQVLNHIECVDDPESTHYNKIVGRLQVGVFDWKSSEKMAEITPEYDLGVFVAYNSYPVTNGNGSCIFLHIWKDADTPTSGCTAMAREDLGRVVAWLDPKKNPYLVQLPESEYKTYKKSWKLP